ncbi:hypothetical protein CEXT_270401 [Caerostris extrusa]|uniref:Uncharacterized protein n=1 Tax=Caerostris extrusa TaxID=172846 RepID=A0AAV4VXU8_CAEEX|nr:hypothetical protein CEXT_270401 [Caerostris extrusa]
MGRELRGARVLPGSRRSGTTLEHHAEDGRSRAPRRAPPVPGHPEGHRAHQPHRRRGRQAAGRAHRRRGVPGRALLYQVNAKIATRFQELEK